MQTPYKLTEKTYRTEDLVVSKTAFDEGWKVDTLQQCRTQYFEVNDTLLNMKIPIANIRWCFLYIAILDVFFLRWAPVGEPESDSDKDCYLLNQVKA